MPDSTPVYALPYLEPSDPPDIAGGLQDLAERVEAVMLGSAPVVRKYTANATWTKPAATTGFLGVWARVTGGGGGSGGVAATSASYSPSAGGGGGGTAEVWIPASALGATVAVTVGAGGTAGTAGAGTGGTGGTSSFGGHVTASGGGGGAAAGAGTNIAYSSSGGTGGSTFGGTASPRLEYQGANGINGQRLSASMGFSGNGGMAGLVGVVAVGRSTTGAGSSGQVPGGGAAGSVNEGTQAAAAGSAGARGEIVITEVYGA